MHKLTPTAFFACWLTLSGMAQQQTIIPAPLTVMMPPNAGHVSTLSAMGHSLLQTNISINNI
jgi:hypothetical protein